MLDGGIFFTFMFRENGNSIDGKEKKKRKPYKVVDAVGTSIQLAILPAHVP